MVEGKNEGKNENIITRRVGNVIQVGTTLALVLREELMDMKLDKGDQVVITLVQTDGKKVLRIEKA